MVAFVKLVYELFALAAFLLIGVVLCLAPLMNKPKPLPYCPPDPTECDGSPLEPEPPKVREYPTAYCINPFVSRDLGGTKYTPCKLVPMWSMKV